MHKHGLRHAKRTSIDGDVPRADPDLFGERFRLGLQCEAFHVEPLRHQRRATQEDQATLDILGIEHVVEQSRARSAVYDVITNGIPVDVTVNA